MAASDEVDVVLNQKNTHAQRKQENQTGQGQMAGGGGRYEKLSNSERILSKKGVI